MKTWDEVYKIWQDGNVPSIEIIKFELGKHHPQLPWIDLKDGRQYGSGNVCYSTAWHIFKFISTSPKEFQAAYKIYAYCRERNYSQFWKILSPVFEKYDYHLGGWWNGNARKVLPHYEHKLRTYDYLRPTSLELGIVVKGAIEAWTHIAQNSAIIRIPDWMDFDSAEYEEYRNAVDKAREDQEHSEYLRLKKKFG